MIIYVAVLVLLIICGASRYKDDQWRADYISKRQCEIVKGIFSYLIIFGHAVKFISVGGLLNTPYIMIRTYLDQAVVCMFLFYSGFGMTESLKSKGTAYTKKVITKRLPKVFVEFAVAVLIYLVVDIRIGLVPPVKKVLLSLIGWQEINNFNWYIFDIFVLYILFAVSFTVFRGTGKKLIAGASLFTILSVVLIFLLKGPGAKMPYFYNTIPCFSLGVWYSVFRGKFEAFLAKRTNYLAALLVLLLSVIGFGLIRDNGLLFFEMWVISFTFLVLVITRIFRFDSGFIRFFGKYVFALLMMQRIPMLILYYRGVADAFPQIYVLLTFVSSVVLAWLFAKMTELMWKIIGRKRAET